MSDSLLLLPGQPVPPAPAEPSASTSSAKTQPSALGAALLAAGPGTYSLGPHLLSSRVGYASYRAPPAAAAPSKAGSSSKLKAQAGAGAGARAQTQAARTVVSVGAALRSQKRRRGDEDGDEEGEREGDVVRIAGQGPGAGALVQDAPDMGLIMPRQDSIVIGRITRVNARQATLSILVVDGQPCGVSTHSLSQQTPAASSASPSSPSSSAALFAAATGEGNHAAGEEGSDFTGVIRAQDVRATEKDKVRLAECFRVGDIVRASVISLGDARSYFLSTAENRLGVIYAISSSAPPIRNVSLANQAASASSNGFLSSAADMLSPWSIKKQRRAQQTETETPMEPISWQEMRDVVTGLVEKRKCAKPDVLS
ncbi:hypothetical protein OC835_001926 [Tilletia horrida]|uniref:Exosome complex component CSL4 C-terminal domain-containing protein n=1 Tax=Tilletia horrida TaxID=155126 RepID=A0AAN6G6T8_9BASI|nr:hypothetical protein OC842_006050 [Tilletia horrida]KAK0536789.1 hypothetical protein OC835_001926 [Tilletia horrida]